MRRVSLLSASEVSTRKYLDHLFPRSLLLLGDLTAPLRSYTDVWLAHSSREITGVATTFRGFNTTIVALVSNDAESGQSLVGRVTSNLEEPVLLALHANEPYLLEFDLSRQQNDSWMTKATEDGAVIHRAVAVDDELELRTFYSTLGTSFWTPAMLKFGHYFGVRNEGGRLVSAAGVNFGLSSYYAQIGAVVTSPDSRGKGLATDCVAAVVSSLHLAGVPKCGLFADAGQPRLVQMYKNLGFRRTDGFSFIRISS